MHFRGSRMMLEAIHPDGRREVLTDATHYEQNWQITYKYKTPHLFPAGTILHTVSWHDNTANNKHNPDPTAWVGWGSRTMDEMGHGWTDIAFLTDEQYREEAREAARRAPRRPRTQQQRAAEDGTACRTVASLRRTGCPLGARCSALDRVPRSAAPSTASGARGAATSARRATRRSIRSTPPTSTSCRSPGASGPTTSASVPTSIFRRRR